MGLDLSHTDAQLDALGVAVDEAAISARHRGADVDLAAFDRELAELAELAADQTSELPAFVPPVRPPPARIHPTAFSAPPAPLYLSFPAEDVTIPPKAAPDASELLVTASDTRPKSGEISLGEPVIRSTRADAREQALDAGRPKSGSYELEPPEAEPTTPLLESGPPAPTLRPARAEAVEAGPAPREEDLFDDLKTPAPAGDDDFDPSDITTISEPGKPFGVAAFKDADAAFNALFDDSPSLRPRARPSSQPGSGAPADVSPEPEEGDETEVIELTTISARPAASKDPFPSDDVLGSTDFEIVVDEEPEQAVAAPAAAPARPPPPPGRPSLLGRLFGKKDEPTSE